MLKCFRISTFWCFQNRSETLLIPAAGADLSTSTKRLPFLREQPLHICARHVKGFKPGPVTGQPKFSWSDLMASGAAELLESRSFLFLVGRAIRGLNLRDHVHGCQQGDAPFK